ncbi:hypothetical protein HanLR1_Chr03g0081221 [Helianthus annuus]|nr:hypothetical protein HanHA89_Chr03g0088091 [Helianthus annuus]KAJ0766758.1 hypothetical protein HanLR1_Chr03g0081221 [Helianthus annuus]
MRYSASDGGSISSSISAHICRQQSAATDVDDDLMMGKGAFAKVPISSLNWVQPLSVVISDLCGLEYLHKGVHIDNRIVSYC